MVSLSSMVSPSQHSDSVRIPQAADTLPGLPPVPAAELFDRWRDWVWRLVPPVLLVVLVSFNAMAHETLLALTEDVLPGCLFHRLTGLSCPGCGGTRAFKAMLEGQLWEALRYNLLWIPTLAVLVGEYVLSWWLWLRPEQSWLRFSKLRLGMLRGYGVLVLGWFVLRNILGV